MPFHRDPQSGAVKPSFSWMYLLTLVPVLTDIIETGGWPLTPRAWFTELAVGLLILLLVRRVLRHQRSLHEMAQLDALTGLGNRRVFDDIVRDECARAARSGQPVALVLFDLDQFKQVNDTLGHEAGDTVLRQFGSALRHAVRERVDHGFRIGGDEFALLLPGSTARQTHAVVARIREHCIAADPLWQDGLLGISAGIAEWQAPEHAAAFVQRADAAMFEVKRANRRAGRSALR